MHNRYIKQKPYKYCFFSNFRRIITKNNQIKLLYVEYTAYFCS